MGCIDKSKLWEATKEAENEWIDSKSIKKWNMTDDTVAYKSLFEAATDKIFEGGSGIEATDMVKFKNAITSLRKDLKSPGLLSNKILKHFYLGEQKKRQNPILANFYESLVKANEYRNNHTNAMMSQYSAMMRQLKGAILEFDNVEGASGYDPSEAPKKRDFLSLRNRRMSKATKDKFNKLDEYEKTYYKKMNDGGQATAQGEMRVLMKFLENEGAMFQDFISTVEQGKDYLVEKYGERDNLGTINVSENKRLYVARIHSAASEWGVIQKTAKLHLVKSIDNVIEIVKHKYGKGTRTSDFLIEEYRGISKQLEASTEGYVPHYLLDVVGKALGMHERLAKIEAGDVTTLDGVLNEYKNEVQSINSNLMTRLKRKSKTDQEYFSRNPILYAQKYVEQVASFNHRSFVELSYIKNLKKLTNVILKNPDSKEANAANVFKKVLGDQREASLGNERADTNETAKNITRILTSMQFVSKLGWSSRGALRNKTQKLLNFGHFGGLAWIDANAEFKNNPAYKLAMEEQLDKHGLQYLDISKVTEGALSQTDLIAHGIDFKDGQVQRSQESNFLQATAKGFSSLAEASSVFTKSVENNNRRSTFNIAFHKRLQYLKKTEKYAGWGLEGESGESVKKDMYNKAGIYASNMTRLLHFEYSKFAKADALSGNVGSVLGQFQHYALSYADLQFQVIKDFGKAMKAGDYTGQETGRVIRYAALYSINEAMSILGDTDFTSYIQNDTVEKVKQMEKFLMGESTGTKIRRKILDKDHTLYPGRKPSKKKLEQEKRDAFYGKGLIGVAGLVPISDLIEIHNLGAAAGYWKMLADEKSTVAWLAGLRKYKSISNEEFGKEVLGMGNIEIERILTRTLPALRHNNPLWSAVRAEFGLFPGTTTMGLRTRDLHKKYIQKKPKAKKKGFKQQGTRSKKAQAAINALSRF